MTALHEASLHSRVLVLCPIGKDAPLVARVLAESGLAARVCGDMSMLCAEIARGVGAILISEEAIIGEAMLPLRRIVVAQPPWQDLPFLVLATHGADSPTALEAMEALGNVTLLERPLQRVTLISATRAALRATQRQLQLRAYIDERERTNEVLRQQTRLLVRDIDERKRLEASLRQSERLYRGIGESIDYGVWVSDAAGLNTYVSDSLLRLLGAEASAFHGLGWLRFLHPDEAELIGRGWEQCVAQGCAWDREFRFRTRDGEYQPILARGVPLRDEHGAVTGWAGIHLDISRLRRAQETLREADRRKDEFLATLAHELRNPIAPIANAVAVLALREHDASTVRWTREIVDRQVRHLRRLVDDLLDVSRITQGKVVLRYERLAIADVVRAAVDTSRPLLDEAGVHLDVRLPTERVVIEGDAVRLAQCLSNLLNNAAKFTPRGGRVEIWAETAEGVCSVHVADTGIGIDARTLPHIFEMFSQGERPLERVQGGLGIGLTLVRSFVELHGGSVEARSSGPGHGSEFVLRIPLAAADVAVAAAPEEAPVTGVPRRVLVVDDNVDAAESLSLLLSIEGFDVRVAHDGLAALAAAEAFRPDVVLLDIGMPRLNGYDAAQRIRAHEWGRDALVVAITGWGQDSDRRRSREAGFDHHLTKPIDTQELLRMIAASDGDRAVA